MDRHSQYIHFSSQVWLTVTGKPDGSRLPWRIIPLQQNPDEVCQESEHFQMSELPRYPHRTNKYPPITGRLINYMHVKKSSICFIFHTTEKHRTHRLIKFIWWIILVILEKVKIPPYFGVNSLTMGFWCRYANDTLGRPTTSLDRAPDTYLFTYS